jgi:hypothetical protein
MHSKTKKSSKAKDGKRSICNEDNDAKKSNLSNELDATINRCVASKVPTEITTTSSISSQCHPSTTTCNIDIHNEHLSKVYLSQHQHPHQWQYNLHSVHNMNLHQAQVVRHPSWFNWTNKLQPYQNHSGIFVQLQPQHYNGSHHCPYTYQNTYQSCTMHKQYHQNRSQELQQQQHKYHPQQIDHMIEQPILRPFHFIASPSQQMKEHEASDSHPRSISASSPSSARANSHYSSDETRDGPGAKADEVVKTRLPANAITASTLPVSPMYSRGKKVTGTASSASIPHSNTVAPRLWKHHNATTTNSQVVNIPDRLAISDSSRCSDRIGSSDQQQLDQNVILRKNDKRLAQARQRTHSRKRLYEQLIQKDENMLSDTDKIFVYNYNEYLSKKRIQSRTRELNTKQRILGILQKTETERTNEEKQYLENFVERKKEKNEKDRLRQRRLRSGNK